MRHAGYGLNTATWRCTEFVIAQAVCWALHQTAARNVPSAKKWSAAKTMPVTAKAMRSMRIGRVSLGRITIPSTAWLNFVQSFAGIPAGPPAVAAPPAVVDNPL